jgi:hypothetical protein
MLKKRISQNNSHSCIPLVRVIETIGEASWRGSRDLPGNMIPQLKSTRLMSVILQLIGTDLHHKRHQHVPSQIQDARRDRISRFGRRGSPQDDSVRLLMSD